MKLGTQTGSFFNHLMSNDITPPVVGKGATILVWSDRHVYFVDSVSPDGKEVTITRANPIRNDQNGMSDAQNYRYERNPDVRPELIKFTYGKWRKVYINHNAKKVTQPINIYAT